MKLTRRCGDAAVAGLNEALLAKAAAAKLLRTDKVRADTTVVEAAAAHPLDSGLLAKAVGTMSRTVARIHAAGGSHPYPERATEAAQQVGEPALIASKLRLRGAVQREEAQAAVARITGELAGIAESVVHDAEAVVRNARRALRTVTGVRGGRLRRAVNDLDTLLERTRRVVAQTRSRLAGVMPDSASRMVSFHDIDARPIRKGRLGKPVEFGYKAQVVDNADGVILDHNVEVGNPTMGPSWLRRSNASLAVSDVPHGRSQLTAVTGRPPWKPACTNSESATWRSRGRVNPAPPAETSNTGKHSEPRSNGEPDPKVESTT